MSRPAKPPRLIQTDESPHHYIVFRGKRFSTGTENEQEANQRLEEFRARLRNVAAKLRRPDEIKIAEAVESYLKSIADMTSSATRANGAQHIIRWWGHLTADVITKETVAAYVAERRRQPGLRKKKVADWTIINELSVLRAAMNLLYKEGRMTREVFVPVPPSPGGKDLWLESHEADLLIQSCVEPHVRMFMELALHTGGRHKAILELKWLWQVDLTRRRIALNPPGRRQTTKRRPPVPMNSHIFELLSDAQQRAATPFVIEQTRLERDHERPGQYRRVVAKRNGIKNIKKGFGAAAARARRTALERARQEPRESVKRQLWREAAVKLKRATPHTLRHTAGTWMAQGGVDMWMIAGWLGHSVQKTTELYAHHHPDYMTDAADALESRAKRSAEIDVPVSFAQVARNPRQKASVRGFWRPTTTEEP